MRLTIALRPFVPFLFSVKSASPQIKMFLRKHGDFRKKLRCERRARIFLLLILQRKIHNRGKNRTENEREGQTVERGGKSVRKNES